jgi:hypothetical protein
MNLLLETTSGLLLPLGTVPRLGRVAAALTLQFATDGVVGLLRPDTPIALHIYNPAEPARPIASFTTWKADRKSQGYATPCDPLAEPGLAWLKTPTLLGRVSYGTPKIETPFFHILLN